MDCIIGDVICDDQSVYLVDTASSQNDLPWSFVLKVDTFSIA